MILSIFRNNNEEITHVNEVRDVADIETAVSQYNARNLGKSTVEIAEAPEGSLLEWLYKKRRLEIKDFRGELIEIQGTLNDLYGRMDWVEERLRDKGDEE